MLAKLMILLMFIACIGMPIFYAVRIWRLNAMTRALWMLTLVEATVIGLLILILGRWDMAGLYTRWILVVIFLVAAVMSWRHHRVRPWRIREQPLLRNHRSTILSLVLLGAALIWITAGLYARHDPAMLGFPLRDGEFVVAQGGDNILLNHHHSHPAQRYALDITAVNAVGIRAVGLLPSDLSHYVIFDKPIVSPCDGKVIEMRDGLPDQTPPTADPEHAGGNRVILACGRLEVTLAHLRNGSVQVHEGAFVSTGDRIGRVGNSGNTTEPHLHIQAVDSGTGKGVQIGFGGRVPARNSIFNQ